MLSDLERRDWEQELRRFFGEAARNDLSDVIEEADKLALKNNNELVGLKLIGCFRAVREDYED